MVEASCVPQLFFSLVQGTGFATFSSLPLLSSQPSSDQERDGKVVFWKNLFDRTGLPIRAPGGISLTGAGARTLHGKEIKKFFFSPFRCPALRNSSAQAVRPPLITFLTLDFWMAVRLPTCVNRAVRTVFCLPVAGVYGALLSGRACEKD